jgi:polar amino acid transport system substrate-binding protein
MSPSALFPLLRRARFFLASVLAGALIVSQPAVALKLLTEENPPLNYTEKGKLTGMATEVVQEIGKRAKMTLDFEVMPWDKAYEKAQADKETCLYATARLSNRENAFKWVGPIATNKWALYALPGFTGKIASLKDARVYRVGGVEDDAKTEYLKQSGITNVVEEKDDARNPSKLTLNRKEAQKIDLWITSAASAKSVAAKAKVPEIKQVYLVREQESFLACSPRTQPATLKALSSALESMKKDGSYDKIIKSYEGR